MYKSLILPLARQEISDAAKWYNQKQKGLGKKFTQKPKGDDKWEKSVSGDWLTGGRLR